MWLPCCYKISIKLVVVSKECIFIHARRDLLIEKNYEMKNSKENSKLSAKKWSFGEILMNPFIYKKIQPAKKY